MCELSIFLDVAAPTEISTLSLHLTLPISTNRHGCRPCGDGAQPAIAIVCRITSRSTGRRVNARIDRRSEEHTYEIQSRQYLVCRLVLEKKNVLECHV